MNKPNIKIKSILPRDYEGYLWYSNAERPIYIDEKTKFTADLLSDFPFVVEGALYCESEDISISIRWVPSGYVITEFDGNLLDTHEEAYKYICYTWAVAKDSQRKVKMREVWTLETDEPTKTKPAEIQTAQMAAFRPSFWIFRGFELSK